MLPIVDSVVSQSPGRTIVGRARGDPTVAHGSARGVSRGARRLVRRSRSAYGARRPEYRLHERGDRDRAHAPAASRGEREWLDDELILADDHLARKDLSNAIDERRNGELAPVEAA